MALQFDKKNQTIVASNRSHDKIFNGEGITLSYTLETDDITQGEKVKSTPYVSRKGEFVAVDDIFLHPETQTSLVVEEVDDGLKFSLNCKATDISEWGVNLPFNFMGKLNGGGWEKQYLFNSPSSSQIGGIVIIPLILILGKVDISPRVS